MADIAFSMPGEGLLPGTNGVGRISSAIFGRNTREIARLQVANLMLHEEIARHQQRIAELEHASLTDTLTGTLNRGGFEDAVRRTLSAAQRHDDGGALAYLDCDSFKSVNDTLGHDAGDAVLAAIGRILKRDTRTTDYVARLHGDEFAVLLVRSGMRFGTARLRLMEHTINNSTVTFRNREIALKISMGIVGYDSSASFDDLMRRADRAMYERKHARRGQVIPFAAE